jgi:hypothetical protein
MFRALMALLGFAAAAALIALAPDAAFLGDTSTRDVWLIAGTWALAGLVAGAVYQAGGVRRPGLRVNPWLFLLVFTPWALLTVGIVAQLGNPDSGVARLTRDVVPDGILENWVQAVAAFTFVSGLLLAFSLVEPLVGTTRERVLRREGAVATPDRETVVTEEPVVERERPVVAARDTTDDVDARDRTTIARSSPAVDADADPAVEAAPSRRVETVDEEDQPTVVHGRTS